MRLKVVRASAYIVLAMVTAVFWNNRAIVTMAGKAMTALPPTVQGCPTAKGEVLAHLLVERGGSYLFFFFFFPMQHRI